MSDNAKLYFCRSRPISHALRDKVELELQCLVERGVIGPVETSEWAALIVPVLKLDRTVRIYGDYRLTINRTVKPDTYPLPRIEDLFATLAGGKSFTKLDLAHAYSQIPLSEASNQYVTINTHKRLYRYNRLPLVSQLHPQFFRDSWRPCYREIPCFNLP